MLRSILLAIGAALVAAPAAVALPALRATPGYSFALVDAPWAATQTYFTTIRDDGDAVGAYDDAAGHFHGLIRDGATGAMRTYDVPGAVSTYVLGINAAGALSGTYVDAAGHQHGFVRRRGGVRTIDVPGAVPTQATSEFGAGLGTAVAAIADNGTVVGGWGDAAGASHGFMLTRSGRRTDLDAPGALQTADPLFGTEGGTVTIRANRRGTVVGAFAPQRRRSLSPVDLRAAVRRAGRWATLLPPGAFTSQAFALTESDVIGGVAFGLDGISGWGWILRDGRYTRIDPAPGLLLSTVADISEGGMLTGEAITLDGRTHGYIGVPG